MNTWDIILLTLLAASAYLAMRHILRRKKSGCTGCCAACAHACGCRQGK